MGPGPYSCAVQNSLASAWPLRVLAAGKGAGISTFGGYFQVLERSRGEMRLSPRRPEKQGPALGNGGLQGEGRERLSKRSRTYTSAPPLGPKNLPKHPAFTYRTGDRTLNQQAPALCTQPFLSSCKARMHCSLGY